MHTRTVCACLLVFCLSASSPPKLNSFRWKSITRIYNMRSPPHGATARSGPCLPHYGGFTITLRHTTLGRTPLDTCLARARDLYLTTHNTHKRRTCMPAAGFEPTIPATARSLVSAAMQVTAHCAVWYALTHCDPYLRWISAYFYREHFRKGEWSLYIYILRFSWRFETIVWNAFIEIKRVSEYISSTLTFSTIHNKRETRRKF